MTKKPGKLPRGYKAVTSSLAVYDLPAALDFYAAAFDAQTSFVDDAAAPSFAAIKIDRAPVFLTLGWPGTGHLPQAAGTARATSQHLYVENVDEVFTRSLEAGAQVISEPSDTYWGERTAVVSDPSGHFWTLATRVEVLSAAELKTRRDAALGKYAPAGSTDAAPEAAG